MNAEELKAKQAPLKQQYREHPEGCVDHASERRDVSGKASDANSETGKALVEAGLHPATGGSGASACSGDMLLEALVACAGRHIAGGGDRTRDSAARRNGQGRRRDRLSRHSGSLQRGARLGFRRFGLRLTWTPTANEEQIATLIRLTERYCVVYQTLSRPSGKLRSTTT
jgi:uncharacterized OsmC-like protein